MQISFVDLKRQNKIHLRTYQDVITNCIVEAEFIDGKAVNDFEKKFAAYCNKLDCITVNSGTDALFLTLLAYEIGPGDEVITTPNSYFSTAMVIEHTGAKVVFADIDPNTYTINPAEVEKKISSRTRALIPIHLFGQPANMDPLITLAKKNSIFIIEDCCQAHGAKYKDKTVPYTETGAFSFYPGKNLGSFGDGGAVVTNNRKVARKIRLLRNDGSIIKYQHRTFGYKSRLDTIQAAILNNKLLHLDTWNELRRKHAAIYTKALQSVNKIRTPVETNYAYHVFHLYVIDTPERNELQKNLFKHGINTVIHYPIPIHLQLPYRKKGYNHGNFPIAENAANRILSLPMFPELTVKEIRFISEKIENFFLK
ncbi:MAG: DegT/DnrJ/EryC1/StrS family aminotransferase [Patescibacteria group bacterium]